MTRKQAITMVSMVLVVSLLAAGCSPGGVGKAAGIGLEPEGPGHPVQLNEDLAGAQLRFGLNLYRALAAGQAGGAGAGGAGGGSDGAGGGGAGENIFISPASAALALAMTYNGARNETARAMAEVLGLEAMDLETANEAFYALIKELAAVADAGVELRIANALWQREGTAFYDDFLTRNRQYFGAPVEAMDFDDPATLTAINDWVSQQTSGRIPELLTRISPDTVLLLINAIYFKGAWSEPFDPDLTAQADFHLPGGDTIPVFMMNHEGTFGHYAGDGFQGIRLPYGDDGRLAMYVFLPDEDGDLAAFSELLTADNWRQWQAGFVEKYGRLALPRFQVNYKISLNSALKDLGMGIAFHRDEADFSGMAPVGPGHNLYISDVLHETFLLVNEEGAEAAGATAVDVSVTSLIEPAFNFVADRPFFVAIQDDGTGTLLFAGSVSHPQPVME